MTSDSVDEIDLDALRRQRSSTPRDEQQRCPECGSVRIKRKTNDWRGVRDRPENYVCDNCFHHFDEPADPPRAATDGGSIQPNGDETGARSVDGKDRCPGCGSTNSANRGQWCPMCGRLRA